MELKDYLKPLRRWWWLLLLATLLAGASSAYAVGNQPPLYSSRTTLLIGSTISLSNPSDTDFRLTGQLATLYADIAEREPIREDTKAALGLNGLPKYSVNVPANSQLIEIVVTDTIPERSQAVATELANQLIRRSPTASQEEDQERQMFVREQLDYLEEKILITETEIIARQDEFVDLVSAEQIADAQDDIDGLQNKLVSLQTIYSSMLATVTSDVVNTISIIEPAALPRKPINSVNTFVIPVAAAIGLTLAAGAAYLLEYLDNSIRTVEDAVRMLNLPILGHIGELPRPKTGRGKNGSVALLFSENEPLFFMPGGMQGIEAFNILRTNLEFAGVDKPIQTLVVASPGPGDGKSTIAVNLALVTAKAGDRVLLLDADIRRPSVHEFFGLDNKKGLSDIFLGELAVSDVVPEGGEEKLIVVTGGQPPPNPSELLASRRMDEVFGELEGKADLTIIDSPPFLLADASILASRADGVLLVIRPGHTQERTARAMLEQLKRANANVIGMVVNRISRGESKDMGGYLDEYYQYSPSTHIQGNGFGRRAGRFSNIFNRWTPGWSKASREQLKKSVNDERGSVAKIIENIPANARKLDLQHTDLSPRIVKRLEQAEYETAGDVLEQLAVDRVQLENIRGLGEEDLLELDAVLKAIDYSSLDFKGEGEMAKGG